MGFDPRFGVRALTRELSEARDVGSGRKEGEDGKKAGERRRRWGAEGREKMKYGKDRRQHLQPIGGLVWEEEGREEMRSRGAREEER